MKNTSIILLMTAALIASSNAAITLNTAGFAVGAPPTVSNTDLGQSAAISLSAGGLSNGAVLTSLNDGLTGTPTATDGTNAALDAPDTVVFTFDTTVNTLGYDITEIFTTAGWNTGGGGRANQGYQVDLTYVDGTTATLIAGAHHQPNVPTQFWTTVQFTDSSNSVLTSVDGSVAATGVASISFDITNNAVPGGIVIFREFDIFGTATIPEPSSALLSGLGLLLFLRRRR